MKPEAPAEVRGEFRSIATSAPGLQVCEHLSHCAQVADKLTVIRSMSHGMRNHNSAAVEALCGRTPLRGDLELLADDALSFPCYGSALSYLRRSIRLDLHCIALPHVMYNVVRLPGQTAGLLGAAFDPLQIESDPNSDRFRVGVLDLPAGVDPERLDHREALIHRLDQRRQRADQAVAPMDAFYDQAFTLLRSEAVRRSLNIGLEAPAARDRYGRHTLGQSLLLARRLVEGGVPFVTVYDRVHNGQDANWDSHQQVFPRHRDHLLPPADQGLSALVEDLDARGLLDSTLVIAMGEFGRTPKINGSAGRDHWPDCFSVVMAGGGARRGFVYGASDRIGAYPETAPVSPGDLAATLFWCFGLDPATEVHDSTGRPYRIATGEPLRSIFERAG